jgi:hypothetical protein
MNVALPSGQDDCNGAGAFVTGPLRQQSAAADQRAVRSPQYDLESVLSHVYSGDVSTVAGGL